MLQVKNSMLRKLFKNIIILELIKLNVPYNMSIQLMKNTGKSLAQLVYASVIGSLIYIRLDIIFIEYKLATFVNNPSTMHGKAISIILDYLKTTIKIMIYFMKNNRQ